MFVWSSWSLSLVSLSWSRTGLRNKRLLNQGRTSGKSTALSTDLADWVTVQTNVLTDSTLDFTDTQAPAFPVRFYRAVVP